jgi:hypothetical protein
VGEDIAAVKGQREVDQEIGNPEDQCVQSDGNIGIAVDRIDPVAGGGVQS